MIFKSPEAQTGDSKVQCFITVNIQV